MLDLIYKKIGIPESLRFRTTFLWGMRFLYQLGFILAWTVITALFIEAFGITNLLWLFLADGVLFLLGSLFANALFLRFESEKFFRGALLLTVLSILGAAIFHNNQFAFFALVIVAKDLFFAQMNIAVLRKGEALFSPVEAQKALPVVDSAVTVGTIASAGVFLFLLKFFPLQEVLFFWLVPLVLMFLVSFYVSKHLHKIPDFYEEDETIEDTNSLYQEVFAQMRRSPFIKFMVVLVFLQASLLTVVEFTFIRDLGKYFSHETTVSHSVVPSKNLQASLIQDISHEVKEVGKTISHQVEAVSSKIVAHHTFAHDLGVLSLIFGIVALCFQLLLLSRVFETFGIMRTMTLYFVGFLAMAGAFIFGWTNMNWVRGYQHGLHSMFGAAYHISFYSMFSRQREFLRHLFEGVIAPFGTIVAVGIVFVLLQFSLPLSYAMVGIALALVGVTILLRNFYTRHSFENLNTAEHISHKAHAIEVLEQRGHTDAVLILTDHLMRDDSHRIIREKIIDTISKIGDVRAIHTYLHILEDKNESTELKAKVLESLLTFHSDRLEKYWKDKAFTQHRALNTLQDLFRTTESFHLWKLIIMNILKHVPLDKSVSFLFETLNRADTELKSVCLRSCTVLDDPEIANYIRKYLSDPSPRVRGHAVIALWKFENRDNLRAVLKNLLESQNEEEIIAGIYSVGEVHDHSLKDAVESFLSHDSKLVHMHALISLAKLGESDAIHGILEILFGADVGLANAAYHMCDRLPEEMKERLKNEIHHEVSRKIMRILRPQKITEASELCRLSAEKLEFLKRLYRFAGKYENVFVVEQAQGIV